MEITPASVLSFPGLEIRQTQHRVFMNGEEINLTRLKYNTLVFLASNPGIVLTQTQIFEAVWNMDSDSCHANVVNVIYNLRKKIEPDSKNPTYIKTVLSVAINSADKRRGMMIDTLSFPGVFFFPCGCLEALIRAAMVICCTTKRPGNAYKTLSASVLTVCICFPYSYSCKGWGISQQIKILYATS